MNTKISENCDKLAVAGGQPVRQTWLPYGRQQIDEDDIESVVATLRSSFLTQGPKIVEFERAVALHTGAKHAVAVNSGTAALHAAYHAIGIGPGDEVITSPISFAATANAAVYLGAKPVFADVELTTGNIDVSSVSQLISGRTKAIVGVDFGGHPCDIEGLSRLAQENNIRLLIDAAHSLGASYKNYPVGTLGDITIFSFHPVKAITTGEGGMAVTNDDHLADRMRLFRTHGIEKRAECLSKFEGPWFHEMQFLGYNYRITDIQAALGTSQMTKLSSYIQRRQYLAERYRQKLSRFSWLRTQEQKDYACSAYHLFPIFVTIEPVAQNRARIVKSLHAENIGVQVHYIPTCNHPFYIQNFGTPNVPKAQAFYDGEISLPIFPSMSEQDQDDVIRALDKIDKAYF